MSVPNQSIPYDPYGTGAAEVFSPAATGAGTIGGNAAVYGTGGGPENKSGTDPLTGNAARYSAGNLGTAIWDNPWAVLQDVFPGINTAAPGYQGLRDFGADPLTLFNIIAGVNSDLSSSGVGGYTNWLMNLYKQLGSVGGRAFNSRELLNNIYNPGPESALSNIEQSGDLSTQVRTLFNLVREASNAGMNPLAARGYQAATARAGDEYLNQMIQSGAGDGAANQGITQWIRQNYGL